MNDALLEEVRTTNELLRLIADRLVIPSAPLAEEMTVNPVKFTEFTREVNRASPKLRRALDWLSDPENASHIHKTTRELQELIGVSHATIAKAKGILFEGEAE